MPRGKTAEVLSFIEACITILEEIQPASVRAVAYQLFIKHILPSMDKSDTNKVSKQLVYAREHDMLPWEWIVDEARDEERGLVWDDVNECVEYTQQTYRRDYWLQQPVRVGVWSEKGTVRGTLAPILDGYQVPFLVTHGHNSGTLTHDMAQREQADSRRWVVLYVGDWDPSGMDMSERDLPRRLTRYGSDPEIIRLGIVRDDLSTLPTFDTRDKEVEAERKYGLGTKKGKDTRRPWFEATYGRTCCELDALNPNILRARVEQEIVARIEPITWNQMRQIEQVECDSLRDILTTWRESLSDGTPPNRS